MTDASDKTGYGFMFGFVDDQGNDFGLASGPRTMSKAEPIQVPGNLTSNDTGVMGSGTKGFTATAVMRLVDEGKISLDDPCYIYVDPMLLRGYNTTMYELFGLWANDVTVRHLIFMQSGLQDFEIGTYDTDLILPENAYKVDDPINTLKWVANQPEKSPCLTLNCTWFFEPGTHVSYSSLNYELCGYLLLSFMPEDKQGSW